MTQHHFHVLQPSIASIFMRSFRLIYEIFLKVEFDVLRYIEVKLYSLEQKTKKKTHHHILLAISHNKQEWIYSKNIAKYANSSGKPMRSEFLTWVLPLCWFQSWFTLVCHLNYHFFFFFFLIFRVRIKITQSGKMYQKYIVKSWKKFLAHSKNCERCRWTTYSCTW